VETIIKEMKEKMGAADIEEEEKETTKADKHQKVMEVVNKGLMQVHGSAPNSKQDGIFWIMCKNANGLNNRISGNNKIAKALDIKDKPDIDYLMYCKHRLNLRHKDNKNNFKQSSRGRKHARQLRRTTFMRVNTRGGCKKAGPAPSVLKMRRGISGKLAKMRKD
jgi:hypothetical protein